MFTSRFSLPKSLLRLAACLTVINLLPTTSSAQNTVPYFGSGSSNGFNATAPVYTGSPAGGCPGIAVGGCVQGCFPRDPAGTYDSGVILPTNPRTNPADRGWYDNLNVNNGVGQNGFRQRFYNRRQLSGWGGDGTDRSRLPGTTGDWPVFDPTTRTQYEAFRRHLTSPASSTFTPTHLTGFGPDVDPEVWRALQEWRNQSGAGFGRTNGNPQPYDINLKMPQGYNLY